MNIDEPFQYYIANFIVINQSFDFSKRWLENAKKVHEAIHSRKLPIVPESPKVREIDQLSLALTVSQKPEDFNSFPPFHWNQSKEAVSKSPNPDTSDYIGGQGWWMKDPSTPLENMNYNKIINYVEAVRFFKNNKLICRALPYFLVTQKGFFYRPHIQGTVVPELNDVNNLSYFPKIRSLIFQIVKEIPQIKNHPMWKEYKDNWIGKHVKM